MRKLLLWIPPCLLLAAGSGCGDDDSASDVADDGATETADDATGADADADADADGDADTDADVPAEAEAEADADADDGGGTCTDGPPAMFDDGFAYLRELHVGAGRDYATLGDAADDAVPGDRIVVHAGRYGGTYLAGLQGTEERPIAIAAAAGEAPPVFGDAGTALQLSDPAWVVLDGLIVEDCTDNGINIDDGGDYETPAGPMVVRNVEIRDIGPSGNRDGLKLSGLDRFVVYRSRFLRWGAGGSGIDMVGCHDGLIAGNIFEHTPGNTEANAVQAKGGSRNVEVRGNLVRYAGGRGINLGGSTGDAYFRPLGIGYEASDIRVLANVFVGSQAPVAYVGCEDSCLVAHNTIVRPERWVLRILNERPDIMPLTKDGRFHHNIVVVGDELRTFANVGGDTDPGSFAFAGNLWFHADDAGFTMTGVPNDAGATLAQTDALVQQDPRFHDAAAEDFHLEADSPAIGQAGALAERTVDFDERCWADPASLGAFER
ncbi:MAG: right-handed parallel beta-helix repeat-containing protein [Deltaproteobacteria bacterium]|nr:right-handed parallel beta-helix repeat-containing protein [Deltaproteobacteria bacterium]